MSSYKLFIDNKKTPPDDRSCWIQATSSAQAIEILQHRGIPDYISFGFDLEGTDTVIPAMHWIMDAVLAGKHQLPVNFNFFVHTENAFGKKIVENSLSAFIKFTRGKN